MKDTQIQILEEVTPVLPDYALRRHLGVWELIFAGQRALLKEETGLLYVAYLITVQPAGEPIHALALSLKATALYRGAEGATEIADPETGEEVPVGPAAELQQRSLALEEAQALWALRRKQLELEAILADRHQIEPVRAEAARELVALYEYPNLKLDRTLSVAQKAVRAVRMALRRLQGSLAERVDAAGRPHAVLRAFGAHLESQVLAPSSRCARRGGVAGGIGVAGSFVYERPEGVRWTPQENEGQLVSYE